MPAVEFFLLALLPADASWSMNTTAVMASKRWARPACRAPSSSPRGESDEGLDVAQPIVVEGELRVIRHKARGQFRGFVELRVTGARRVW